MMASTRASRSTRVSTVASCLSQVVVVRPPSAMARFGRCATDLRVLAGVDRRKSIQRASA